MLLKNTREGQGSVDHGSDQGDFSEEVTLGRHSSKEREGAIGIVVARIADRGHSMALR